MFFRYFKQGDALENNGQTLRVVAEHVRPYLIEKVTHDNLEVPEGKTPAEARAEAEAAGVIFKYKEVTFKDWYDGLAKDTIAKGLEGADAGEFWSEVRDPATEEYAVIACSLETGEPVEKGEAKEPAPETAAEAPAESEPAVGTEATPEPASEATEAPVETESAPEQPATEAQA